jgi:cytochrome c oxidase subunit II
MRRRLALPLLSGAIALVAGGCIQSPATSQAKPIHDLFTVFVAIAIVVAAIVWGLTTWSIVRYRRRPGPDQPLPQQIHGSARIELTWTAIPLITILVLFGLTVLVMSDVQAQPADPAVNVQVTAFRWGWRFDYVGTGVEIAGQAGSPPTLRLPAGQNVHFSITSIDVIHSFYVPAFLFKRDAIPGLTTTFDLDVQHPGTYNGQCAEFCGILHDQMIFTVQAMAPTDFQAWLASEEPSASTSPTPSAP